MYQKTLGLCTEKFLSNMPKYKECQSKNVMDFPKIFCPELTVYRSVVREHETAHQ